EDGGDGLSLLRGHAEGRESQPGRRRRADGGPDDVDRGTAAPRGPRARRGGTDGGGRARGDGRVTTVAQTWEASPWRRMQAALIPSVISPLTGALGRTWRFQSTGWEQFDALMEAGRPPIIACWHEVILPSTYIWR